MASAILEQLVSIFEIDRCPLVSVLLPMYNAERYICDSIDSILCQTYLHWELVVVDDGCTDNSAQIVHEKYATNHSNIKLITLPQNSGIVEALNVGISHCHPRSTLIARMDADDISLPHRIETQVQFMLHHQNIDVCATGVHLFDDKSGDILKTVQYKCLDTASIKWSCLFFCPLNHPTVMFRKSVDVKYDDVYPHCEDYHLWFHLLFHPEREYEFANIDGVYLKLRKRQQTDNKEQDVNVSKKYKPQQIAGSVKLTHDYVCKLLHTEVSVEVIECIRNPTRIQTFVMFENCYHLLEQWEQFVLQNNQNSFVKHDCDARMAELISLCMQTFMMNAIQMMQKWKRRKPDKHLVQSIL